MTPHSLRQTLAAYTTRFPAQAPALADLLFLLDQNADITSRHEFRGHITASALLLNADRNLLLIHHNALNRWLQPGGHLDPSDTSPAYAALRELTEETGIDPSLVRPAPDWESTPLWLDRHWIPANPKKNEPRHEHWDLQYLFLTDAPALTLQTAEVSAHAWQPPQTLSPQTADRIQAALRL